MTSGNKFRDIVSGPPSLRCLALGPYEWHGWSDPQRLRRSWAESGLLSDDGGVLIVLHGTDRVGVVDWHKVQTGRAASNWTIGIGLAPEFRGRGYGSDAQQLLVRYLFAHTPVNRVEATTEIANVAEQRALEKAGFTREGILRGASFRQGRYRDYVIYSVLRDEAKLEDSASEARGFRIRRWHGLSYSRGGTALLLDRLLFRPVSRAGPCERSARSPIDADSRWSLMLLSPLLSARVRRLARSRW